MIKHCTQTADLLSVDVPSGTPLILIYFLVYRDVYSPCASSAVFTNSVVVVSEVQALASIVRNETKFIYILISEPHPCHDFLVYLLLGCPA